MIDDLFDDGPAGPRARPDEKYEPNKRKLATGQIGRKSAASGRQEKRGARARLMLRLFPLA